ncbi:PREDICTED: patatin-like protein 2 [Nelumbo nucifera]|uniref:Patatin n=1 Tax=Nelumbo nucifera TaxID=4432 RepID=A0A1U8QB79_NELNU|nr:PREDICTED: patatin-like protein 2 [Nelumbo nucifera]
MGPFHDGKYLRQIVNEKLGSKLLEDTVANLVIPTFDIKNLQPVIFSTYEVFREEMESKTLEDICIGTSAAPIYLPAHGFKIKSSQGKETEFNLIDGCVFANNPARIAISEVYKELLADEGDNDRIMDFSSFRNFDNLLLLSLGTGTPRNERNYNAEQVSKWSTLTWAFNFSNFSSPIVDVISQASADMICKKAYNCTELSSEETGKYGSKWRRDEENESSSTFVTKLRLGMAWKHSIDVEDADYRAPVGVILFNHSDFTFQVKAGDRIA